MTPTEYLDRKFASDKPRQCWMCSCQLTRGTATVDHLQPKSRGGKDKADNFRLACKPCNSSRGNTRLPSDVVRALKGRPSPKRAAMCAPIQWPRADPTALAAFDPSTRYCTMNCGPHRDDPRTNAESKLMCSDCVEDWNR